MAGSGGPAAPPPDQTVRVGVAQPQSHPHLRRVVRVHACQGVVELRRREFERSWELDMICIDNR